jgi:uncharacterized protein (TIGR03086 family)
MAGMASALDHDWVIGDFDRAAAVVDDLISSIGSDGSDGSAGWGSPTPCSDWDARALVRHIVNGNLILTAPVVGDLTPDWETDRLGDDPAAAFRTTSAAFSSALSAPDALTRTYDSVLGTEPGTSLVRMRVSELLVHGWDLARTLGRPTDLLPDLAEPVLAYWQAGLTDVPRDGMPFDDAKPVRTDASATDRLAAYLGRSL